MKQLISHIIRVQLFNANGVIQCLDEYDIADRAAKRDIGRKISHWRAAEEGNKVVTTSIRIVRISIS